MKNETQTVSEQKWLATFSRGIAALDAGNFKKAMQELEVAVDVAGQLGLTEQLTNSLLALGDAQRMSGKYKDAEETLRRAVDFSFKHPEGNRIPYAFSLSGLGRLFIEQNRTEEAVQMLEMAVCAASAEGQGKHRRARILHCQISSIMQNQKKKGASDELGIAAAMLRQLNTQGVVDTRPVVFSFGGEEEIVLERDIPTFGGSSTKKTKKERRAVEPKPRLRIVQE